MTVSDKKKNIAFIIAFALASLVLILIPTGFERSIYVNASGAKAEVLSTDDSTIIQTGLFRTGDQRCFVRILNGEHKGLEMEGINLLSGSLKDDKVFVPGDIAWVLIERDSEDNPIFINMIDYYRQGKEVLLVAVFVLVLVAFSGLRGIRMVLSFVFAFLAIWKLLIPTVLKGTNPLLMCTSTLMLLTVVTLPMVSGANKRSLAAIIGSIAAMMITVLISLFMTWYLRIHGSVLEMSESLLYSGFMDLDLTSLFSGVVCLSAGGAIMDLSIDVSAAMWEVKEHAPDTSRKELFRSAMEVGKAGVGTQITTLLLAYMGSYLTLMMVYMAQATPVQNIFASKSIAAEILQTLAGSFGIVLVTPLTALTGMLLFKSKAVEQ
ncbi:MAG: YibE/F family protein [Spirochaetes bacterium]|uniref:YibE/F family protein n=1 Tax=Candidatus Ornithospirochaeta stercoripullorum TaxID=2840899 RepID=A0A9D9DY17_9SPIO|nr:YibE/F family protein [Candidatus Ornithospirochaeta stercoripullorum]